MITSPNGEKSAAGPKEANGIERKKKYKPSATRSTTCRLGTPIEKSNQRKESTASRTCKKKKQDHILQLNVREKQEKPSTTTTRTS